MAKGISSISINTDDWTKALDKLSGSLRVSLARSMAVAGGRVIRDEAKARVPVKDGTLRDALYLAFKDARSSSKEVTYSVTWNSKKAPHGHLVEFGHWQYFKVVRTTGGGWATTNIRLDKPKWIPAYPFLRPAQDAAMPRAIEAMFERARVRLPELLAQQGGEDESGI